MFFQCGDKQQTNKQAKNQKQTKRKNLLGFIAFIHSKVWPIIDSG